MMKDTSSNKNIIPFPNLGLRLLEKGKDYLGDGKISEAIQLLQQAIEEDEENPDIYFTLTAAYIKQGNMQKAKETVEYMLRLGLGDYFDTVEMYITILFQLHEYQSIVQLISMLMDEHQVPYHKMEHFTELLHLCERLAQNKNEPKDINLQSKNLFEGDVPEIVQNISQLTPEGISYHLDSIKLFLSNEKNSPFLKTVLLNMLQEFQLDEVLKIVKYGKELNINIAEYPAVTDVPFANNVKELIRQQYEQNNPTFLEYATTLCERFFFNIYPLEKTFSNEKLWAAAIMSIVNMYVDGFDESCKLPNYAKDEQELQQYEQAKQFILLVEQNFNQGFSSSMY